MKNIESAEKFLGEALQRAAKQIDEALGEGVSASAPDAVAQAARAMAIKFALQEIAELERQHVAALRDFCSSLTNFKSIEDAEISEAVFDMHIFRRIAGLEESYRQNIKEAVRTAGVIRFA